VTAKSTWITKLKLHVEYTDTLVKMCCNVISANTNRTRVRRIAKVAKLAKFAGKVAANNDTAVAKAA